MSRRSSVTVRLVDRFAGQEIGRDLRDLLDAVAEHARGVLDLHAARRVAGCAVEHVEPEGGAVAVRGDPLRATQAHVAVGGCPALDLDPPYVEDLAVGATLDAADVEAAPVALVGDILGVPAGVTFD